MSQRGPPGKFYRGSHATDLLGTLRTKGSFARIQLFPEAIDAHDQNFRHFTKRLSNDELVGMFSCRSIGALNFVSLVRCNG